jgi:DsbC/DsbD-like thiol-disulfide interchange protein
MSTAHATLSTLVAAALLAVATAGLGQGADRAGAASPWVELHSARVRLIGGAPAVKPAKAYLAGVEVTLQDGWKTYWRMPGDAGVPPAFDWTGSGNVAAVSVRYPAPSRHLEASAVTIGYHDAVLFPVEVVPRDPARPVDLALMLNIGICREICIPAEAKLTITLRPAQLEGDAPSALLAAVQRVPRPQGSGLAGDPKLERVSARLDGERPHLAIEARFPQGSGSAADVFVEAPDGLYVPQPKRLADTAGGTLRFEVDLSRAGDARELAGKTLTLTLVGETGATEATWMVPRR